MAFRNRIVVFLITSGIVAVVDRTAKTIDLKTIQASTKLFTNQALTHNCYNALLYDGFLTHNYYEKN